MMMKRVVNVVVVVVKNNADTSRVLIELLYMKCLLLLLKL